MRRCFLVFMMVLLPFQWSWAAAAAVCEHEAGKSRHFGHHAHVHADAQQAGPVQGHVHGDVDGVDHAEPVNTSDSKPDSKPDAKSTTAHPDCGVCHGVGLGVPSLPRAAGAAQPASRLLPAYSGHLPEPPVERFLRPPLRPVA